MAPPFLVGARVEAQYGKKAKWYRGVVRADNGDGTYRIEYDDGDTSRRKPEAKIRLASRQALAAPSATVAPASPAAAARPGGTGVSAAAATPAASAPPRSSALANAVSRLAVSHVQRACSQILHCVHQTLVRSEFIPRRGRGGGNGGKGTETDAGALGVYPAAEYAVPLPGRHNELVVTLRAMVTGTARVPTLTLFVSGRHCQRGAAAAVAASGGGAAAAHASAACAPDSLDVASVHAAVGADGDGDGGVLFFKVHFVVPRRGRDVAVSAVEQRVHVHVVRRVHSLTSRRSTAAPALALAQLGTQAQQAVLSFLSVPDAASAAGTCTALARAFSPAVNGGAGTSLYANGLLWHGFCTRDFPAETADEVNTRAAVAKDVAAAVKAAGGSAAASSSAAAAAGTISIVASAPLPYLIDWGARYRAWQLEQVARARARRARVAAQRQRREEQEAQQRRRWEELGWGGQEHGFAPPPHPFVSGGGMDPLTGLPCHPTLGGGRAGRGGVDPLTGLSSDPLAVPGTGGRGRGLGGVDPATGVPYDPLAIPGRGGRGGGDRRGPARADIDPITGLPRRPGFGGGGGFEFGGGGFM